MKKFLLAIACTLSLCACSDDVSMNLSLSGGEGIPGVPGLSAYDVWKEMVENGTIEWNEDTDATGFFRFLKGKDGEDGINGVDGLDGTDGIDGIDGQSAYDIWAEAVGRGLGDPHNPGKEWDKSKTSMSDFYYFMMGKDGMSGMSGLSAYGLWVREVTGKAGLENPHKPGTLWPTGKTNVYDFWEYLKGEDGEDGAQGIPGLSAYDVWKEMVENGTIEWDEGTEPDDFFRFLKGKDGKDGINGVDGLDGDAGESGTDGIDGLDGQSAYAIWAEAVGRGLGDPHNPGKEWDKSKTSMSDFYYFMTGNDGAAGISAYGLWVTDVRAGLIENPHQPGTLWPADQTTMMDFWHYLRGEDGEDGISPPATDPGQAGQEGTPVSGKPNVLVRFQNAAYSEYVNPEDGTVKFQVFNDAGAPAPLAEVKGMPGVIDPVHIFKANEEGYFTIPREYLPSSGSVEERFGTCTVSYTNSQNQWVTEESAANTYVPQKVDVRLRILGNVTSSTTNTNTIGGAAYITVPILVERRLNGDGDWSIIPDYLEDDKYYFAYELSDPADPTSFTYGGKRWNSLNIEPYSITTTTPYGKRVERPSLKWDAMDANTQSNSYHLWDNKPHYVNIVLESYYGMVAHTDAVIQVPPVQFMPLPAELTMSGYNVSAKSFGRVSGTFDTNTVNTAHYYEANLKAEDRGSYTFYGPVQKSGSTPSFTLLFKSAGNETKNDPALSNLSPTFSFNGYIEVGCDVYLMASGRFFISPGNTAPFGKLQETFPGSGAYHIVPKDDKFVFTNIPVIVQP